MTDHAHLRSQLINLRDNLQDTNCKLGCQILDDHDDFRALGAERGDLLGQALATQRFQWISVLLERGFHLTREQALQQPLLPHAGMNLDLCRMLVELGVDVNQQDAGGDTALHRATIYAREDVCQYLLDAGASPSIFNSRSRTALHNVSLVQMPTSFSLAKRFIEAGASSSAIPKRPPSEYTTPFQLFCKEGQSDLVELLVEHYGEDPSQTTIDGVSLDDLITDAKTRHALWSAATRRQVEDALPASELAAECASSGAGEASAARPFGPI